MVNARLVNRHPFRNNPMKLMSESELEWALSAPSIEGRVVKMKQGVCLIQTIQTRYTLPLTVKWWCESSKKPVKEAKLPGRRMFVGYGMKHVAATLGPNELHPGSWRVESWLSLEGHEVKQLEIPFEVV